MAMAGATQELCEELTCPICLDYFRDPVMIAECGHNFCRDCLTRSWGEPGPQASCPVCKQIAQPSNLRANRQLANIVAIAKKFGPQLGREGEAKERVCEKHHEPLKLFCGEDRVPICVVCDRSREHRHHDVVPLEEAAQECKVQISHCLENLRKDKEEISTYKTEAEKESEELLKQTETEKQKMVAEFRKLRQFLEDQENLLLAQLKGMEEEIIKKREEHLARISESLSSLDGIIQELEEKCQQRATDLLQDVASTLQRCEWEKFLLRYGWEKFEKPVIFPPALKWKIWEFRAMAPILEKIMTDLKDALLYENQLHKDPLPLDCQLHKENMTLDPDSAHPQLIISKDWKCLTLGDKWQHLPTNNQRFYDWLCVRGKANLSSQMHYWDVEVGNDEGWAVGICRAYRVIQREESLGPPTGVWAIGKWSGEYRVVSYPHNPSLCLSGEPKRIRVLLNFPARQVSFFDAATAALLHISTIPAYPEFQPFFWLLKKSHLRFCP